MKEDQSKMDVLSSALEKLRTDLRSFIQLSLEEDEQSWGDWISDHARKTVIRCWQQKNCDMKECPAYENTCGRCWIIAGTMCGGEPQGQFAKKYTSCRECDVYIQEVLQDPIAEMQEHVIVLIHSLRSKQMELKELAMSDTLTGLKNRRCLEFLIPDEMKKIQRTGKKQRLLMIDLNELKKANDQYGHIFGDYIIKECAGILSKSVRSSDLLARIGGDEFVILMSDDWQHSMEKLTSRIKEELGNWNRLSSHPEYKMSFSMGSSILGPSDDFYSILKEADRNMYKDKKAKNSIL